MAKPQPVYVDRGAQRTAMDITNLGECDALLRRARRDVEELNLRSNPGSQRIVTALYYAKQRVRVLQQRKEQLLKR